MGLIIDKIVNPNFSDLEYFFDFMAELTVAVVLLIGVLVIFHIRQKNPLFQKTGGSYLLLAFVFLFLEALMNFIDGNLIWFNEVDPFFILPFYQIWRIIRFILTIIGFYSLMLGFKNILHKATIIYGIGNSK